MDVVTADLIVGKPTPTGFWANRSICARRDPCGSWLASDSGGEFTIAIAGKPHRVSTSQTVYFLACSYSGITLGIAACNEAIRLSDAGWVLMNSGCELPPEAWAILFHRVIAAFGL